MINPKKKKKQVHIYSSQVDGTHIIYYYVIQCIACMWNGWRQISPNSLGFCSMALRSPLCFQIPLSVIPCSSSSSRRKVKLPLSYRSYDYDGINGKLLLPKWPATAPIDTPNTCFKCFSRNPSQSESEFEFERLFSNLNEASLKREPGSTIFFFFLYLFFHLLGLFFVILGKLLCHLFGRKFIQCNISCSWYYGMQCTFLFLAKLYYVH